MWWIKKWCNDSFHIFYLVCYSMIRLLYVYIAILRVLLILTPFRHLKMVLVKYGNRVLELFCDGECVLFLKHSTSLGDKCCCTRWLDSGLLHCLLRKSMQLFFSVFWLSRVNFFEWLFRLTYRFHWKLRFSITWQWKSSHDLIPGYWSSILKTLDHEF